MMDRRIGDFRRFVDGGGIIRIAGCTVVAVVRVYLISRHLVEGAMGDIDVRRPLKERHSLIDRTSEDRVAWELIG